MRKAGKRMLVVGLVAAVLTAVPWIAWISLNHSPSFYREAMLSVPAARRQAEARRFVAQSLQLRNDIHNEPTWEAAFSAEQVNSWLAEDLVVQFADQIPPEVHEPRVAFDPEHVTLAFQFDQGPIRSVIWIVAKVRVIEDNLVALTLEKVRAGVVPISPERYLKRIANRARDHGLEVEWERDGDRPMAMIRYQADPSRDDVVLERILISHGEIRLAGRSERGKGDIATPILPSGRLLQSTYLRRKFQVREVSDRPSPGAVQRTTRPTS